MVARSSWYAKPIGILAAGVVLAPAGNACAQPVESPLAADSVREAFQEGNLLLQVRPRYTAVDQAGVPQAHWASVRTVLGWQTLEYRGFSLVAEAINVARFDTSNAISYTNTPAYTGIYPGSGWKFPFKGPYYPGYYPLVEDPNLTDVNRLFVQYDGPAHTTVRLGRQVVRIDNQRFIGDYDYAQLPQVFDGVTIENSALQGLHVLYGYFSRVRNAYGVQWSTSTNALNVRYEHASALKVAAYGYFQEQPITGSVTGLADNSNRIYGGRFWGALPAGTAITLFYSAELAQQRSYAGGSPLIDALYRRAGAGAEAGPVSLRLDWELLGSNSGLYGFQTPLGSTQLFTGWANMFASTPTIGLADTRATAVGRWRGATFRLAYHSFRSDFRGLDLGQEWDAGIAYDVTRRISLALDYADYQAGDPLAGFRDTRKLWVTVGYKY